jgi:hypothetical protein
MRVVKGLEATDDPNEKNKQRDDKKPLIVDCGLLEA